MLGGDECGLATRGLADVVGLAVAFAPVHPQTAGPAPEEGPQQIRLWGVVGTSGRTFVTLSRETERRAASSNISLETRASWAGSSDQIHCYADSSCLPASAPAVPHLVAGELRVAQDLPLHLSGPTCRSVVEDPVTPAAGSAQGRRSAWPGEITKARPARHVALPPSLDRGPQPHAQQSGLARARTRILLGCVLRGRVQCHSRVPSQVERLH
jgi:hypothetical protein